VAPPGREQASIQHGRFIQACLKLNSGHFMPALTFPDLVTLPVCFQIPDCFKFEKLQGGYFSRPTSSGTFASLAFSLPKPVRASPEPVAQFARSAHKPD